MTHTCYDFDHHLSSSPPNRIQLRSCWTQLVVALYKKERRRRRGPTKQLITHNTKNIPLILFFCSIIQFNSRYYIPFLPNQNTNKTKTNTLVRQKVVDDLLRCCCLIRRWRRNPWRVWMIWSKSLSSALFGGLSLFSPFLISSLVSFTFCCCWKFELLA